MQQVHLGLVLLGNARGALHDPLGEGGKVGGGNDTTETGHGEFPENERLALLIIVISLRLQTRHHAHEHIKMRFLSPLGADAKNGKNNHTNSASQRFFRLPDHKKRERNPALPFTLISPIKPFVMRPSRS
ncbi:hypothetical protein [Thiobacillus sp.]